MLRLVADTNTVVSALLWQGAPHRLFEMVLTQDLSFYSSRALIDELAEVLARRKLSRAIKASGRNVATLVRHYEQLAQLIQPRALRRPVGRDPDDEAVLACAVAARADLIVSGDHDLQDLKVYQRIPIVGAADALAIIAKRA